MHWISLITFQYANHFFQGTMSLCVWFSGPFHIGVSFVHKSASMLTHKVEYRYNMDHYIALQRMASHWLV